MENWGLRISASISLGLHLLFIFISSILLSNAEVHQPSLRHIKVTLYPLEDEKKSTPKWVLPFPVKTHQMQKLEKKEALQEHEEREPVFKKGLNPPIPLPVRDEVREIPIEEPKVIFPLQEEEKIVKEVANIAAEEALGKASSLKREENLSPSSISSPPETFQGNTPGETASGKGGWVGQGGSPVGDSGSGLGAERRGVYRRISGEGKGFGQQGSRGEGSRKGIGIWGKFFSPSGGASENFPRYAENPKPPYPEEAWKKGMEGEVLLRVEVLANGGVGQIEVKKSSGHEILDRSALHTVKQWKFIPAKRGEDPIPLWVNIPIKYQLQ